FFIIVAALLWAGFQLFTEKEDPLDDRLDELQANQIATSGKRTPRRRAGGGFANSILYLVSSVPGGEDSIRSTERELAQAGSRNKAAVVYSLVFQVAFMVLMFAAMLYFQRDNPPAQKLGGLAAAFILGYLLPQQVLHRLVKRYRTKLQDALPDTIDLLGIVL